MSHLCCSLAVFHPYSYISPMHISALKLKMPYLISRPWGVRQCHCATLKASAAEGFIYEWKFVTIVPSRAMGFLTALNC